MVADNLQRRIQIEEEIKRVQAQLESVAIRFRQGIGWGSDDKANDLVERTEALTLYQHLEQKRRQLEHARARLDRGLDGVCEMCGQQIDPARLRAITGTTHCVTCQRRLEQGIEGRFRV